MSAIRHTKREAGDNAVGVIIALSLSSGRARFDVAIREILLGHSCLLLTGATSGQQNTVPFNSHQNGQFANGFGTIIQNNSSQFTKPPSMRLEDSCMLIGGGRGETARARARLCRDCPCRRRVQLGPHSLVCVVPLTPRFCGASWTEIRGPPHSDGRALQRADRRARDGRRSLRIRHGVRRGEFLAFKLMTAAISPMAAFFGTFKVFAFRSTFF